MIWRFPDTISTIFSIPPIVLVAKRVQVPGSTIPKAEKALSYETVNDTTFEVVLTVMAEGSKFTVLASL